MTKQEIIESGVLEQFVLGELSADEIARVEQWLQTYPELKAEISEIESSLEFYAQAQAIEAPDHVRSKVMNQLSSSSTRRTTVDRMERRTKNFLRWMTFWLIAGIITALFFLLRMNNQIEELQERIQTVIDSCADDQNRLNSRLLVLEEITAPDSRKVNLTPTEKYPETVLYLFTNNNRQKNFIQATSMPTLASDESFQLWSLKGTDPPTPMDVFEDVDPNTVLEVGHIANTDAYAITVENRGGAQVPNLDNLIGVMDVSSD